MIINKKVFTTSLLTVAILSGCGSDEKVEVEKVAPTPQAPVANQDEVTSLNGGTVLIDVLANDTDADGDTLSIISTTSIENGILEIIDNKVSYTPKASYAGQEVFTYQISDGELTSESTVTVNASTELTLTGKVTDKPIAKATVTIQVGDKLFEAIADDLGNYSLPITVTDSTAVVKITAKGSEAEGEGFVEFISIPGTFGSLIESAGDDNELSSDENFAMNVTNVTTAKFVLMTEANDGKELTSIEEIQTAEKSISSDALLEIAAVIKLIVDNPEFNIPDTSKSLLDFVKTKEEYNTFVEAVVAENIESNPLTLAIESIIDDKDLVEAVDAAALPSLYYTIPDAVPGFLARGGDTYEFAQDGTGRYVNDLSSTVFTWLKNTDGEIEVTFAEPPLEFFNSEWIDLLTDDQAMISAAFASDNALIDFGTYLTGLTFKIISNGELVDSVREVKKVSEIYSSFEHEGVTYQLPTVNDERVNNKEYRDGDKINTIAFTEDLVIGTWAMEIHHQIPIRYNDYDYGVNFWADMVTFNADGSASGDESKLNLTWLIDSKGSLVVTYPDMKTQTITLLDHIAPSYGAYNLVKTVDDKTYGSYEFSVKQDINFTFTADFLVNSAEQFWQTYVNGWIPSLWDEETNALLNDELWGWDILNNKTMLNNSYYTEDADQDGNATELLLSTSDFNWEIVENTFIFNGTWGGCDEDVLCHRREWIPLAEIEDGFYTLEKARMNVSWNKNIESENSEGYAIYFPARLNIYKKENKPTLWVAPEMARSLTTKGIEKVTTPGRKIIYPSTEKNESK